MIIVYSDLDFNLDFRDFIIKENQKMFRVPSPTAAAEKQVYKTGACFLILYPPTKCQYYSILMKLESINVPKQTLKQK